MCTCIYLRLPRLVCLCDGRNQLCHKKVHRVWFKGLQSQKNFKENLCLWRSHLFVNFYRLLHHHQSKSCIYRRVAVYHSPHSRKLPYFHVLRGLHTFILICLTTTYFLLFSNIGSRALFFASYDSFDIRKKYCNTSPTYLHRIYSLHAFLYGSDSTLWFDFSKTSTSLQWALNANTH